MSCHREGFSDDELGDLGRNTVLSVSHPLRSPDQRQVPHSIEVHQYTVKALEKGYEMRCEAMMMAESSG